MIYHAMIQRISPGENEKYEDIRREIDDALDVAAWRVSRGSVAPEREPVDAGAPAWWHGDEEASVSFLKTVGVNLDHG